MTETFVYMATMNHGVVQATDNWAQKMFEGGDQEISADRILLALEG